MSGRATRSRASHDRGRSHDAATEAMLSVREVSERLNVSTATVHRLIEARDLGHVRIGIRTIRVSESALADYLERCTVRCLR